MPGSYRESAAWATRTKKQRVALLSS